MHTVQNTSERSVVGVFSIWFETVDFFFRYRSQEKCGRDSSWPNGPSSQHIDKERGLVAHIFFILFNQFYYVCYHPNWEYSVANSRARTGACGVGMDWKKPERGISFSPSFQKLMLQFHTFSPVKWWLLTSVRLKELCAFVELFNV